MLSQNSIKEFASKWQTTEQNVAREYFQHVFLSAFYGLPESGKFAFKGGTALRILYNSPRFSEDLDFTGSATEYSTRKSLGDTVAEIKRSGFEIATEESKPTSGGWFAIYETTVHAWPVRVEINISARMKGVKLKSHAILVSPMIVPSYTLITLDEGILVEEKIRALLDRKKPRDFFDAYYILRSRMAVGVVAKYRHLLLQSLGTCSGKSFTNELKMLLPRSFWNIVNNLADSLRKELERF